MTKAIWDDNILVEYPNQPKQAQDIWQVQWISVSKMSVINVPEERIYTQSFTSEEEAKHFASQIKQAKKFIRMDFGDIKVFKQ